MTTIKIKYYAGAHPCILIELNKDNLITAYPYHLFDVGAAEWNLVSSKINELLSANNLAPADITYEKKQDLLSSIPLVGEELDWLLSNLQLKEN